MLPFRMIPRGLMSGLVIKSWHLLQKTQWALLSLGEWLCFSWHKLLFGSCFKIEKKKKSHSENLKIKGCARIMFSTVFLGSAVGSLFWQHYLHTLHTIAAEKHSKLYRLWHRHQLLHWMCISREIEAKRSLPKGWLQSQGSSPAGLQPLLVESQTAAVQDSDHPK